MPRGTTRSVTRSVTALLSLVLLLFALASCGGSSSSNGGTVTLNWWAYNEPSGSFREAADRCTRESHGRYRIAFNALGNDADTQRQSLVRRLAAKDASIDLMSMDVVWTGEFAEAGWIRPWPASFARQVRKGTLAGPLATATYQGKLYAAPANSNTQLLWYRKDLIKNPPKTWDAMIDQAAKLKKAGRVEIQGAAYEGTMVWFNALVTSAGGRILDGPTKVGGNKQALRTAARIMSKLAGSKAADPSLKNQKEDQNRLAFETGQAAFQVNYPFIYPSAKANNPKLFKEIGWAPYPGVEPGKPAKAPIGGFNWGVSSYTAHPQEAFAAATCLRDPTNQRAFAIKGGLPPTLSSLYDDKAFKKDYPFAGLVRRQLEHAGVRPVTPLYADVSLAVYTTVSPPGNIDLKSVVKKLTERIGDALKSKGLL
ncbi:MAG: transporter substrate-binding protein [Solirubrobacterales bacterium]|nr:transporter substrate-binding protein [Solirubrobacterales bacterium]